MIRRFLRWVGVETGRVTLCAIARLRPPVADHVSARAGFCLETR